MDCGEQAWRSEAKTTHDRMACDNIASREYQAWEYCILKLARATFEDAI